MLYDSSQKQRTAVLIVSLVVFAAAFSFVEGSVVYYLRLLYDPAGSHSAVSVPVLGPNTLNVEIAREAATLVMIAAVAMITAGTLVQRFARFVLVFGVWDITYYIVLKIIAGWPRSIFETDILFLIPVPWLAPVIVPVAISVIGITGALAVEILSLRSLRLRIRWEPVVLIGTALAVWLCSFMLSRQVTGDQLHYHWLLFSAGTVLSLSGILLIIKNSLHEKVKQ
jgi:hypothetical protein